MAAGPTGQWSTQGGAFLVGGSEARSAGARRPCPCRCRPPAWGAERSSGNFCMQSRPSHRTHGISSTAINGRPSPRPPGSILDAMDGADPGSRRMRLQGSAGKRPPAAPPAATQIGSDGRQGRHPALRPPHDRRFGEPRSSRSPGAGGVTRALPAPFELPKQRRSSGAARRSSRLEQLADRLAEEACTAVYPFYISSAMVTRCSRAPHQQPRSRGTPKKSSACDSTTAAAQAFPTRRTPTDKRAAVHAPPARGNENGTADSAEAAEEQKKRNLNDESFSSRLTLHSLQLDPSSPPDATELAYPPPVPRAGRVQEPDPAGNVTGSYTPPSSFPLL